MQAARGASLNLSEPDSPHEVAPESRRRLWLVMALVATGMYAVVVTGWENTVVG